MLLIHCPWCGARPQTEFTYMGDATVTRPSPEEATSREWYDYVYTRDNPCGEHLEWWHHTSGCRQAFKVRRDTKTHEVIECEPARPGRRNS